MCLKPFLSCLPVSLERFCVYSKHRRVRSLRKYQSERLRNQREAGDLKGLAYKQNSTETHENHNTTTLLGLLPGELRISFVF